jgi:hypothetical protein
LSLSGVMGDLWLAAGYVFAHREAIFVQTGFYVYSNRCHVCAHTV